MCHDHDHGAPPWEHGASMRDILLAVGPYFCSSIASAVAVFLALQHVVGSGAGYLLFSSISAIACVTVSRAFLVGTGLTPAEIKDYLGEVE